MNVSERDRLEKLQKQLLYAASDMNQAIAAAQALQQEGDGVLARALETAMAVCYMRPFTKPSLRVLQKYVPTGVPDGTLHSELKTLRDKSYAHTDPASGRTASLTLSSADGVVVSIDTREGWGAFNRNLIPNVVSLAERQRDRFYVEAAGIQVRLDSD